MSLPATTSSAALWEEFREILQRHFAAGHDSIDTINRLLRKNPWLTESAKTLQIPKQNLRISEESWEVERLWRLIHPMMITPAEPARPHGAVLILRSGGAEYLIDGRRRINHWKRSAVVGPHRALVVESNDI
jgi:hypothetical protein